MVAWQKMVPREGMPIRISVSGTIIGFVLQLFSGLSFDLPGQRIPWAHINIRCQRIPRRKLLRGLLKGFHDGAWRLLLLLLFLLRLEVAGPLVLGFHLVPIGLARPKKPTRVEVVAILVLIDPRLFLRELRLPLQAPMHVVVQERHVEEHVLLAGMPRRLGQTAGKRC